MIRIKSHLLSIACVAACAVRAVAADGPEIRHLEEAAFRAAASAVAPCVTAIETVGGLDTVGELLVGTGPSSGLIVSEDGYIVSSTFNFAHKPASIIVALADGTRAPARIVARDDARNWILLKIEVAERLPVPQAAPEAETKVGQWSVAVGRSFDAAQPNLSVGVVSAVNRIWGKALQTDAKISSANYGGALVDLQGRVLGVLVPLSPNQREEAAGAEWYDSGIGFAVPLEHIQKMLPRLKAGENLKPGLLGVSFRGKNVYADPPLVAKCRAGSPSYVAGVRPGDRIAAVDGRPVDVQSQVMEQLHRRYAGDTVRLTVARGGETFEHELKLVEKLEPYRRPFFGMLAERAIEPQAGVAIRYVYPDSPAARAGLRPGDVVTALQSTAVRTRDELRTAAADAVLGRVATWEFTRDGAKQTVAIEPIAETDAPDGKLPVVTAGAGVAPTGKKESIKINEFPNTITLYVPPQYDDAAAGGLAVLLHPQGGFADDAIVDRWRKRCRDLNWLLLVPQGVEGNWGPRDLELLQKIIVRTAESYRTDAARTALVGYEEGGVFAVRAAVRLRDYVRAVVTVNAVVPAFNGENEPYYSTSFFFAAAKGFPGAARAEQAIEQIGKLHYPVYRRELPEKADDWDEAGSAELLKRLDALDRI